MFLEMFQLKILNSFGELYEISSDAENYIITEINGLTPTKSGVNSSIMSGSDGERFDTSRFEKRNIVITIRLRGDVEFNRQKLYWIFPQKSEITLFYRNKYRDVKISGYVETIEGDIFTDKEQMQISVLCPNPFFEDVNELTAELNAESREIIINNQGEVPVGFSVETAFEADVRGITLFCNSQHFGLEYTFLTGDSLRLNLYQGNLRATIQRGISAINGVGYITDSSTLPELKLGENRILIISAVPEVIRINYHYLYRGV